MDRLPKSGGSIVPPTARGALRVVARDGRAVDSPAVRPVSPADLPLDDVIAQVLTECLDQFEAHAPKLRNGDGAAEAVHQVRVSLRRLRAFLGLLRERVPDSALAEAAGRAKTIAGALGPARDWHVLRESLKLDGEPDRDFDAFLNEVESRRARAIADARAAVGSHLARQFVQSLRQAISRRSWRASADSVREPGSARRFAVATLERLRQRATKRSANLVKQAPERRHRARIAFKKARYAGEFFKRLFEKDSRVYLRGVAKIQDVLGADNDLKTADALLLEIETAGPTPAARIEARRRREELTRAGHKNVRRLKRVEERMDALKPFWR